MTSIRGFQLIRYGGYAIAVGVLLGWAAEHPFGLSSAEITEPLELFFLASGAVVLLAGCIVFCIKEPAKRLLFTGAVASTVSLLVIPGLVSLTQFGPNVHDWTGIFFFLWLLSCVVAPGILLVGLVRSVVHYHRERQY